MASISWANPINGGWADASHWSPQIIPDNGRDDVTIAATGANYTIYLGYSEIVSVHSLTMAGPNASLDIGFACALTVTTGGGAIVDGSTLFVGDVGHFGINNAGGSSLVFSSSELQIYFGSVNLSTNATVTFDAGTSVSNGGMLYINDGAVVTNNASSFVQLFNQTHGVIALAGGTFTGNGVVTNDAGSSIWGFGTLASPVNGSGVIMARGGTLDLTGTLTGGPSLQIDTSAGSNLKIDLVTTSPAITINNANQTLEVGSAGNLTLTTAQNITNGTIKLSGGTLTDSAGITIGSGATLRGFGTVTAGATAGTDVDGVGTIIATGGSLEFKTQVDLASASAFHIASTAGNVLKFDAQVGTAAVTPIVTFDAAGAGQGEVLDLRAITLADFHGKIANFQINEGIRVAGAASVALRPDNVTLDVFDSGHISLGTIAFAASMAGHVFHVIDGNEIVLGGGAPNKVWVASGSGNWSAGANWNGGTAPQAGDDVGIPTEASVYTVSLDINSGALNSLVIGAGATLAVGSNILDVTGPGASAINLADGGQITFAGGTISDLGALNVGAGSIIGFGTLNVAGGTIKLDGGLLSNTAGVAINAGTSLVGRGTVTAGSTAGTDVDGTGTVTVTGGTLEFTTAVNLTNASAFHITSAAGNVLKFDDVVGTASVHPVVTFDAPATGAGEVLDLQAITLAQFHGQIANFRANEGIRVTGAASATLDATGKILTVFDSGHGSLGTLNFTSDMSGNSFQVINGDEIVLGAATSNKTWINAGSGLWSNAANWSGGVVPQSGDNVVIGARASPYTVTLDVSSNLLNSIALQGTDTTLAVGAKVLSVTGSGASAIDLTGGGKITIASGSIVDFGAFNVGAGGVTGFGTLNAGGGYSGTGTVTASGGTLDMVGAIPAGSLSLAIANVANSDLKIEGTATVAPIAIVNATQTLELGSSGNLTITGVQNVAGGTIKLNGGTLNDSAGLVIGSGATLAGPGTVVGALNVQTAGAITLAGGTLTASSGITFGAGADTASLSGFGTVAANLSVAPGATGTYTITAKGGGTLDLTGSIGNGLALAIDTAAANTLKIDSNLTIAPVAITDQNQTLQIGAGHVVTINGAQNVINGTLRVDGTLNDASGITLGNFGKLIGQGKVTANVTAASNAQIFPFSSVATGTLELAGNVSGGLLSVSGSKTLVLDGTASVAGLVLFQTFGAVPAVLELNTNASLTVTGTPSNPGPVAINDNIVKLDGAASTLAVAAGLTIAGGTISGAGSVAANTNITGFGTISIPLTTANLVTANNGTLDLTGTVNGPTLAISSTFPSFLLIDGAATTQSAISITTANQTLRIGAVGSLTINAAESISNGTLRLDGGQFIDGAGLTLGNSALLTGFGRVSAPITASASATGPIIRATGGTLELAQQLTDSNNNLALKVGSSASDRLLFDGIGTARSLAFQGSTGTLELNTGAALLLSDALVIGNNTVKLDGAGSALLDANGILLGSGGTLKGAGSVTAGSTASTDVDGVGTIIATGGTLEFKTPVDLSSASAFHLAGAAGNILKFDAQVGTASVHPVVTFDAVGAGHGEILDLRSITLANFHGKVANFLSNEGIRVTGAASATLRPDNVTLDVFDSAHNSLGVLTFTADMSAYSFHVINGDEIVVASGSSFTQADFSSTLTLNFDAATQAGILAYLQGRGVYANPGDTALVQIDAMPPIEPAAQIAEFSAPMFSVDTASNPNIKAIIATGLNATVYLTGNANVLLASGNGNDVLVDSSSGNNQLYSGAGDDTLLNVSSGGNHSMDGGDGNDVVNYSGASNDTLTGGLGNDVLVAFGNGTVTVDGGDGDDSLQSAGTGAQTLAGGNGDDTLLDLSSGGNHSLDGGNGNDILNASGASNDTLAGGLGNDVLVAFGNGTVMVDGGDGSDSLQSAGTGAQTLAGGNGDDTLLDLGSGGNHALDGGNGNDVLNYSGSGNDTVAGGLGNDVLVAFGNGTVMVDGGDGNDSLLSFGGGAETLAGGNGDDTLLDLSSGGNHLMDGGNGNDVLNASGASNDTLTGGLGNDTLAAFGGSTVTVGGGDGNDSLLSFGGGAETLAGGNGEDTLLDLGSGAHSLDGGNGNDVLNYSGLGSDTVAGGLGNDTIGVFGSGTISVDAGDGDDRTIFGVNAGSNDTIDGSAGVDTVMFQGKAMSNIVSESTTAGVTKIVFDAGSGGQTVFVQNVERLTFSDGPQTPPYPTIP